MTKQARATGGLVKVQRDLASWRARHGGRDRSIPAGLWTAAAEVAAVEGVTATAVHELAPDEQRAFFSAVVKMIRSLQEQGLVPLSGMCVTCTHVRPNVREGASPHHCALVDAPLALAQLRLDGPEHMRATDAERLAAWERFVRPS
jgi:hypothetical protein